jgi:hypothetical protein
MPNRAHPQISQFIREVRKPTGLAPERYAQQLQRGWELLEQFGN